MTEPASYTKKATVTVQSMYIGSTAAEIEAVRVWLRSILGETAVKVPNQMTTYTIYVETETIMFQASGGVYVCWDGEALSAIPKDIFEFFMAKDA